MSVGQYLLARLMEHRTMSAITALATGIAVSVSHPTVQAIASAVATAAGIAAMLIPGGDKNATVAKLVAGGLQGAAGAVAANTQGNNLNVAQTVAVGITGAATGVAEAAANPAVGQVPGGAT